MRDYFDFKKLKLVSVLTYAGSLPFIIAAILMYWDLERFSLFGDVEKIINSYGLIIVVFIAGSIGACLSNYLETIRYFSKF